jgi:hypothetical protein
MQIRCLLHNYNVLSIIPERIIKFHLVITEELHGNKFCPPAAGGEAQKWRIWRFHSLK